MTNDVLGWTRTMVQTGRESVVLQLRRLPKVKRYINLPEGQPGGLQVEA
jgi:hypothetical protein